MLRFSNRTLLGLTATALVACGAKSPPAPPPRTAAPAPPPTQLGLLVERYWAEAAALTPWYAWGGADMPFGETPAENIAPQSLADSLAIERRYLASMSAVPRPSLDAQSKLTYDIFARGRTLAIEGFTYPLELMPINPYEGMPRRLPCRHPGPSVSRYRAPKNMNIGGLARCASWNGRIKPSSTCAPVCGAAIPCRGS